MTSQAGLCAPEAAWSASARSTACIWAIARWCSHAVARARAPVCPRLRSASSRCRANFSRDAPPPRLSLPRAKIEGLRDSASDLVGLLRFDAALAAMSAEDFVRACWSPRLHAREVWVGRGFPLRHATARATSRRCNRSASVTDSSPDAIEPVALDGERVSSTRIRDALAAGEFETAARLLGRPFAIGGHVVRGNQLGRTLGYPTANLRLGGKTPPLSGIFAVRVHGVGRSRWPAVASFGMRPTVGGVEPLLEAHLFDFDGDLYGRRIEVEFVAKLRDEEKFADLPALVEQMHRDAAQARACLTILDDLHAQRQAYA